MRFSAPAAVLLLSALAACGSPVSVAGESEDPSGAPPDADVVPADAGDAPADAGEEPSDASSEPPDAAAARPDASTGIDAGRPDAGRPDAGAISPDAGTPPAPTTALLRPANPMPCADPAVVSEDGANQVFFIFCTGMGHVWRTADWVHFTDVRATLKFDLTGLPANGKQLGAWWAPGLIYSKASKEYVMWVSVPDGQATYTQADGWSARSLAVLTARLPAGPWTFQGVALNAGANEHYIDPFLFIDHDGSRYAYWKQYGGGLSSSIMGARVDSTWTQVNTASRVEIMNGYGGAGTWEDNVRENPAVWYDPADGRHHMLFSGGHWRDDSYATGHALSGCGPLCLNSSSGGWHMADSGDRGILQVVRAFGDADFMNGGPGGAVFVDDSGQDIVYAAAARSAKGDAARYLMRDSLKWKNRAPYVDTAGHRPLGF